jgi:streptogramin lyase
MWVRVSRAAIVSAAITGLAPALVSCGGSEAVIGPPIVGAFTSFAIPTRQSSVGDIAAGPDGALWFTETSGNRIGRITTAGAITEFVLGPYGGDTGPLNIAAGRDGALWFTEPGANTIGRMTAAGSVTHYAVPTPDSELSAITVGADGAQLPSIASPHIPKGTRCRRSRSASRAVPTATSG